MPRKSIKLSDRPAATTRRYTRSITQAAKEMVPPELIPLYYMEVMKGNTPRLVEDDRCEGGWRVDHEEHAIAPTVEQRMRAAEKLWHMRDGLPAQSLQLEAAIRQANINVDVGVDPSSLATLSLAARRQVLGIMQQAMLPELAGGGVANADVELDDEGE